MGEVTREELAAMTDEELLAFERAHHGDLYMSLVRAKGMQRVALQFWHLGAARTKAGREAQAGSGFVVAPNRVMSIAHVMASPSRPDSPLDWA